MIPGNECGPNFLLSGKIKNVFILKVKKDTKSVALAWLVELLPSNPAARARFRAKSENLTYILGLGVCVLYLCPVPCRLRLAFVDHIFREARHCVSV